MIRTRHRVSMTAFKRNQVEEAISAEIGEIGRRPSSELQIKIKRLLETDREMPRNKRSRKPEISNFAFFSEEAPGKGVEILFSAYEAFSVYLGLRLQQHGWPQQFVVRQMRLNRPELEEQHQRILRQDKAALFDQTAVMKKQQAGSLYFDNTDPVFLTIVSGQESTSHSLEAVSSKVCRGIDEVSDFVRLQHARSWSLFELVRPTHTLADHLAKTLPRKRGR